MSCVDSVCGTGGWVGQLPGDPDNNSVLSATPAFGGIDVSWTYPVLNPHAVAHTVLYRGYTEFFNTATERCVVSGNFFYDKTTYELPIRYYYWIKMVSVNGTEGALIGPASAVARPTIEQTIELMTGKIDSGVLAQSLKSEIGKITSTSAELLVEVTNRIGANAALGVALKGVQDGLTESISFINTEVTQRQSGDSALVIKVDAIAAANASNLALIQEEKTVRVSKGESAALQVNTLVATVGSNQTAALAAAAGAKSVADLGISLVGEEKLARVAADGDLALSVQALSVANTTVAAAVKSTESSKIGYAVITGSTTAYDGNGSTIVYSATTYPDSTFPEYAVNRTRIIDKLGVTNWNATAVGIVKPLTWLVGLPLATAIKAVSVTGPNGEVASLETAMIAQKDLNGQFKGMYTAKVSVNGLIGGFGIYNDGASVEAGFDVDTFWVGRTRANKRKPFIIDATTGETFIDQAVINQLTFDKLRAADGSVIVSNGKLTASYIDSRGLSIKDALGNVILAAGTALDYNNVGGVKPPSNANYTTNTNQLTDGANLGSTSTWAGTSGVGKPTDNATVGATLGVNVGGQITAGNSSTFIGPGAIQAVQIGAIELTGIGKFSVKSGTSGPRMEMDSGVIKIYGPGPNGTTILRVQIGDLSR